MIELAIESARSASKILMENFGKISLEDIKEKDKNDFLTYVDEQSENTIIKNILHVFPDHSILAEESGLKKHSSDYEWIIDPLDGTKNFISDIPFFSISIGLRYKDQVQLGVVLDPVRNELFHAQRDGGAYLNGKRIQVGNRSHLEECLLATGFPFKKKHYLSSYVKCFQDIFQKSSGIRRMGSAALDLAYVAAGRFDGFWELGLNPWDMAAGSIIIEEAGGKISDFWGKNSHLTSGYVTAANKHLHPAMIQIIQRYFHSDQISAGYDTPAS
jgi:myo-inositol-1(or 4)-monophosphatase